MSWKEQVEKLELEGSFDIAIFLLKKIIKENPNDAEAYIFLLYRLMDTLLEGDCYWSNSTDPLKKIKNNYYDAKRDDYIDWAQEYFEESYAKFSENAEYIYYTGIIATPAPWYFGIKNDLLDKIYEKMKNLDYNNMLLYENHYRELYAHESNNQDVITYAKKILNDPSLQKQLASKGYAGDYVVGRSIEWAKNVLKKNNENI